VGARRSHRWSARKGLSVYRGAIPVHVARGPSLLLLLACCGALLAGCRGEVLHAPYLDPWESKSLSLRDDRTFSSDALGEDADGTYTIRGSTLTLKFANGPTLQATLRDNSRVVFLPHQTLQRSLSPTFALVSSYGPNLFVRVDPVQRGLSDFLSPVTGENEGVGRTLISPGIPGSLPTERPGTSSGVERVSWSEYRGSKGTLKLWEDGAYEFTGFGSLLPERGTWSEIGSVLQLSPAPRGSGAGSNPFGVRVGQHIYTRKVEYRTHPTFSMDAVFEEWDLEATGSGFRLGRD